MKLLQRVTAILDLPPELAPRVPRLTLEGDSSLLVENYGGVARYDEERVVLRTALGPLTIRGRELRITRMNAARIVLSGRLIGAAYGEESREASR